MNLARGLDSFIFVALLAVIIIVNIPYGCVDPWWEAVFECAIWSITSLWLLKVCLGGEVRSRKLLLLLPIALLTAYAFAQALTWPVWLTPGFIRLSPQRTLTIDRYQTWLTARKLLALTCFFGMLLLHTSSTKRLAWLVRTVGGLGLASAVFGIVRQLVQPADATGGFILPFLFPGLGYGQYISPNVFAYLMEMSVGLTGGLILGGAVRRGRVLLYLAAGAVMWTALVLSSSRGGVIGFVCAAVFLLFSALGRLAGQAESRWAWTSSIWARGVVGVAIVAILIGGVFWLGGQNLIQKSSQDQAAEDAVQGLDRTDIWRSTVRLIKDNRWAGVGFGSFFLAIPQYQLTAGRERLEQAHDDYLELAATGGAVGVILAAWFVFNILRAMRTAFRSRDDYRRAICLGASAGMLAICVHSFVDFGLQVTGIAVVFCALLVMATAEKSVKIRPSRRLTAE